MSKPRPIIFVRAISTPSALVPLMAPAMIRACSLIKFHLASLSGQLRGCQTVRDAIIMPFEQLYGRLRPGGPGYAVKKKEGETGAGAPAAGRCDGDGEAQARRQGEVQAASAAGA